jgi:GNAT superfamily N-acetyltransferase
MATIYRNMLPHDEDAVFDLRISTWGGLSRDWARQGAYLDPDYSRHTFVAVDEDGTLLSSVRYWPRYLRDERGRPVRVGCVASVVTVEQARRQGHARKLMQMALDSMREEGFDWAFLFSSDMGVPLYESLDFRRYSGPYYRGRLVNVPQAPGTLYRIERFDRPFDIEDRAWQAVRTIYAEYNAQRPLSLVRDDSYWRGYFARRAGSVLPAHSSSLLLASTPDGEPAGYLMVHVRVQEPPAGQPPNPYDQFFIGEIGFVKGHEDALLSLLRFAVEEIQQQALEKDQPGGTVFLPNEPAIEESVRALFGDTLELVDDRTMMARPTSDGCTDEQIAAVFTAPGAHFWVMDDF